MHEMWNEICFFFEETKFAAEFFTYVFSTAIKGGLIPELIKSWLDLLIFWN